jgi:23S rRNA (guanine745-N1)-methyltransferase
LGSAHGTLKCSAGHSFDIAREGYINLLPSNHRSRGIDGDVASMLHARRRFLEAGHYRPLLEALADDVRATLCERGGRLAEATQTCVLEVGCGEGYYLGSIQAALGGEVDPRVVFVGADLSKAAARLGAKHYPQATFIVADLNRRLYVEDASVAVLLDIFAPRNAAEFARVLEPGGIALIVIPAESHLATLRDRLGLLGIQEDKEARTLERFGEEFRLVGRREVRYPLELSADAEKDLVEMGPNHWHQPDDESGSPGASSVTEASFLILRLERTDVPAAGNLEGTS